MTSPRFVDAYLKGDHSSRNGQHPEALCMHITDGESAAGAISHWAGPTDASAHYIVDKDGTIYRTVREEYAAWANGAVNKPDLTNPLIARWVGAGINPNSCTISIEIVGRPGPIKPAAQWTSVLWLADDVCRRWGIPRDRTHVIGHYQIDSVNRARCPSLTDAQWGDLTNNSEDALLEAEYRRNRARMGNKRFKGILDRPYLKGVVLACDDGWVATTPELTAAIQRGGMDDLITYLEEAKVLTRL